MDPIKVGKFIANLRKERGLTQEELAEKINVSNKTISKWEVGINVPDTNCLYELSKEFNVPTQDILNGGEIQNNEENNDSIKNGINFYNKLFIKKVTKIVFLIIIGIIATFSILYTICNYNKVQVYDITSNDDAFEIKGYLIFNSKESIFVIDNIRYFGMNNLYNNTTKYFNISIKNEKQSLIYYRYEDYLENPIDIISVLNSIKISFATNSNEFTSINYDNINDFNIYITYSDENSVDQTYQIKLNMKKHYSNTKLVY